MTKRVTKISPVYPVALPFQGIVRNTISGLSNYRLWHSGITSFFFNQ